MNFLVAARGGDPGGEGGMSKFGAGGMVRSRIESRVAVYGDCGAESNPAICSSSGLEGIEGPSAGPWGGASCGGRAAVDGGRGDATGSDCGSASDYQL